MAFTTPTNSFKKPPSCYWFSHSCPGVSSASATNRWQVQIPHSTKGRFCNAAMVFRQFGFNSWSNMSTMSFDESQRYVNMTHYQSCADFRLLVDSNRGDSYARMVPRGTKDGVPGNTCITPFRRQDPPKPTWNQATRELKIMKEETSKKVSLAVPNVQYAGTIITESHKHETEVKGEYEKFQSEPSSQSSNGNFPSQKRLDSKQKFSEDTVVNGVHIKDLQFKSRLVGRREKSSIDTGSDLSESYNLPTDFNHQKDLESKSQLVGHPEKSVNNVNDFNETYIVPIDSKCTTNLQNRLKSIYDKVLVVDNISIAKEVVKKLTTQYRHLVHACDTEVASIDVKLETPVNHGEVICFSIYSGHEADFGNGKSCIWVDVLDGGGKHILDIFSPFFENPMIKKVWHNYSFDNHVIENYGLKLSGFHADTMHMARLWDSSRRMSGGYSLEALTSDVKGIMSGADLGPNEELIGKVSMKTIFGRRKLKKDGSEGKVVIIPPVEELQRFEREPWVCYSALDSISTLKLYERLKSKLSNREWKFNGVTKGTLFDFYEQYWRPFGELLVKMETNGMFVDRAYLKEIEKVAKVEQKIAADRFRNWASKLCPDAKFMNVGSDTQLRQLFFGGIINSKDPSQSWPLEKEFKVPNVDNIIEEGKKTATKFRKIKLSTICSGLETETYTASGWPSVSGAVLKTLAGKISMDYDIIDEEEENDDDLDSAELVDKKRETYTNNTDAAYGTAYAAFGGGYAGQEACHAIAALCEVCSIDSLISNFILPLQGSHISGRNGRIHCSLNINTETGRLSARRPNLQNQPALEKDRYKIRQAFIATPGNSLIVADYGQLELRILAHLANCKSMLDAFEAGGDFHSRTAMNMYPYIREAIDREEVLLEWHPQPGQETPPVPLLKDKYASERRKAKMLNFSIAYGKTPVGLARDWKVSVNEARETVARWYAGREEVLKWQEARKKEARTIGCVYTLLGRARTFPSTKTAGASHRGHIERAAINTPVQGSAADVAMCAMLEIAKNTRLKDLGWKLLLQVHDEVILEGPTESAEVAKAIVVECMSKPFDGKNILKVGLSVDAKFAESWYAAK
uniref:DNA polymerase I B, chloroplastic/mitochondrial isoform X2 n=1 Tax=Erigeron canadensis TaxID=72917 RepID=UPI001CB8DDD4|nr:DNA polymerase I B, chloroplastic/mitochondrial isoform X2 [Erigeron canadensis]